MKLKVFSRRGLSGGAHSLESERVSPLFIGTTQNAACLLPRNNGLACLRRQSHLLLQGQSVCIVEPTEPKDFLDSIGRSIEIKPKRIQFVAAAAGISHPGPVCT